MDFVDRAYRHYSDVKQLGLPVLLRGLHRRASSREARLVRTVHGAFYIRPHTSDMEVLRSVFGRMVYDLDRVRQGAATRSEYERICAAGHTPIVIDGGANVGIAARYFARAYPRAVVLAVEPDEDILAVCRKNTEVCPNICVVPTALGGRSGCVNLEHGSGDADSGRTERADHGIPITVIAELKDLIPNGELLIVKIDVEGFEKDVFSGEIGWVSEPHAIIVEPHDWMLPGDGTSFPLQDILLRERREMILSGDNLMLFKSRAASARGDTSHWPTRGLLKVVPSA
ncbi:FkbM family methyltransferase [Methylobacterium sp. 88A]|uniref:FkbM family methyltransferase n=1 Tax=Methylobacterium sp. 88A TaxID=1131813 RepID=UPI0003618961|nr:FkbM family methyltransferase [Methylobacterium sp. 88A]